MDAAFRELLGEFLLEAGERIDAVEALLLGLGSAERGARRDALARLRRELHTLKGNAGMMGMGDLQQLAHALEDEIESLDPAAPQIDDLLAGLDAMRDHLRQIAGGDAAGDATAAAEMPPAFFLGGGDASVRVPFAKIDQLVEMLAEILIFRNRLSDAIASGLPEALDLDPAAALARARAAWETVEETHAALEKTLNRLQEAVTDLGMVPLQLLFRSLGRIVHDESRREGKEVTLDVDGGETPIDKTLLETAGEALGHLVRNAVIHGIETPAERRRAGKPEQGTVRVGAAIEGGEVMIEVRDDGAGIDLEALRRLAPPAAGDAYPAAGEEALFALLFEEGVTTRGGADLSAGRGVGLAAVKKSVERQGGRIEVSSSAGRGSAFVLRLPLTASILRSLLLRVDGEDYALPLTTVTETLSLEAGDRHELNHAGVLRWRGGVLPLLDLGLAFATAEEPRRQGYAVVIESGGRLRALAVDDIIGIRDIVVRGLDPVVGQPIGISGSTILGDGRVIMILDPASLMTIPPFVGAER
ncbi:MAG: hypothetical protein D6696_15190 [Acidobacteria bacterium]|nr:MAG: hypothetical protein D6696_15190 [Acidobacteriota bacterium]